MAIGGRTNESNRVCLRVLRRSLDDVEVEIEADVSVGIGDEVPVTSLSSGSSSSISMYCSMVGSHGFSVEPVELCSTQRLEVVLRSAVCHPASWRKEGELESATSTGFCSR
jgi:hypothetical protein